MVARASVAAALVMAGVAAADPAPKPVDIKPLEDKLLVFEDADGGIYVVYNERGKDPRIFYGTARDKKLHAQVLEGSRGRNGEAWHLSFAAPRAPYPFMGEIARRQDGSFVRSCGEGQPDVALTPLGADKAKAILDKYQFLTTPVIRKAYLLARDTRGVYYYVDVLRPEYSDGGNRGHRVFVGKKGALKQLQMRDIASDTGGDVFSTKDGELRLVHEVDRGDKAQVFWISRKQKNELVYLDLYMNQPLIYRDLGLYKIPGTICGNI